MDDSPLHSPPQTLQEVSKVVTVVLPIGETFVRINTSFVVVITAIDRGAQPDDGPLVLADARSRTLPHGSAHHTGG